MTPVGRLSVSVIAAPLVAGCSGEPPSWVRAEGWRAAQCEAAAKSLVDSGDLEMASEFEMWRGLTDPFAATTDSRTDLRFRAQVSVGALFDAAGKAREFFSTNCGADAVVDVRRAI